MTEILVDHGKHGDDYYDASTPEAKKAAALRIIEDRLGNNYIFDPSGPHFDAAKEKYESAQAEWLLIKAKFNHDSVAHAAVKKAYDSALSNWVYYRDSLADFKRAKKAVEEQDGNLAWQILMDRMDYEYEYVSIEKVWIGNE